MRLADRSCFVLLLVLAPAGPQLLADEPPAKKVEDLAPPTAKELADKRMVFMKSALSHFTIQVGNRKEASRAADPCLRFTDPVSNSTEGVVAVYAHNGGRPDAIAQFFFNVQKKWIAEFTIIPDGDVTILLGPRTLETVGIRVQVRRLAGLTGTGRQAGTPPDSNAGYRRGLRSGRLFRRPGDEDGPASAPPAGLPIHRGR